MNYVEALRTLLAQGDDELIQVLYIRLSNEKVLVFVGAPVSEEDAAQIEEVTFGEQIPPLLVGMSTMLKSGVQAQ